MLRSLSILLLVVLGLQVVEPAFAARRRVVVRRGPHPRTTVVVHRGWPLRRPARVVVVRPARTVVRVTPAFYVAPIAFAATIVAVNAGPAKEALVWEDSETLRKDEDWTEVTLNCDSRGTRLWLDVRGGRAQFDWAEVVFENGETRVVDFRESSLSPGLYFLLDFKDGRKIDHVRLVARAKSEEAKVALMMEK